MRFKGLDLNLLAALDVLLDTRSVSRSAERLHLSQPAMSSALGRLRAYFGDPLLVVHGKRLHPTPFAERLAGQVKACLRSAEMLIATSAGFDPSNSDRTFRVIASDYMIAVAIVPLVALMAEQARNLRIEIVLPSDEAEALLDQGAVDLLITPDDFITRDHPAELLFEERHVIAGWSGNPIFGRPVTEEDVLAAGHVGVTIGNERTHAFGDRELEKLGKARRLEVVVPSFAMVPWLLEGAGRLSLMHERLARTMAGRFPLAYAPLPFPFPVMRQMVQHHQARAGDEGLAWLRSRLREVTAIHPRDG